MASLPPGSMAGLLRSAQKDDQYSERVSQELSQLALEILGPRVWVQWKGWIDATGKLLYYGLTTLFNYQTLGEEYCGLVQVGPEPRTLPSKARRLLMVLLLCYSHIGIRKLISAWEKRLQSNSYGLRDEARISLQKCLNLLSESIPLAQKLNLVLFYFYGGFYHLSKRISGVGYVQVGQNSAPSLKYSPFKLLGIVSLCNFMTSLAVALYRGSNSPNSPKTDTYTQESKGRSLCTLCLDVRKNTSCTPCGHLFCWECIQSSLQAGRSECPLCREEVEPSRVVPLMNYD